MAVAVNIHGKDRNDDGLFRRELKYFQKFRRLGLNPRQQQVEDRQLETAPLVASVVTHIRFVFECNCETDTYDLDRGTMYVYQQTTQPIETQTVFGGHLGLP